MDCLLSFLKIQDLKANIRIGEVVTSLVSVAAVTSKDFATVMDGAVAVVSPKVKGWGVWCDGELHSGGALCVA